MNTFESIIIQWKIDFPESKANIKVDKQYKAEAYLLSLFHFQVY